MIISGPKYTTFLLLELRSPQFAFIFSVHGSIGRAGEFLLEVLRVAERSDHSEATWRVGVGENLAQERLRGLNLAPDLGVGDEEHLLVGELSEAGQGGLRAETLNGPGVGPERLVDAAVVRNILTLRVSAIQLKYFPNISKIFSLKHFLTCASSSPRIGMSSGTV